LEDPVKPETARGVRRSVPRRRRTRGRSDSPGAPVEPAGESRWSAELADFDPAEFAEFLEADDHPVPADPAFRERLRQQLWTLVRDRSDGGSKASSNGRNLTPLPDPKPRR
jgi:hypothetical protein